MEKDDNWWNIPNQILRPYNLIDLNLPFYGEPYFYVFIKKLIIRKKFDLPFFEPNKESDKRYKKHIKKELNKLYQEINNINAKLIIAPVTIASHAKHKINFYHLRAVNMLNEVLKDFSKKKNVFKSYFRGRCCVGLAFSSGRNAISTGNYIEKVYRKYF